MLDAAIFSRAYRFKAPPYTENMVSCDIDLIGLIVTVVCSAVIFLTVLVKTNRLEKQIGERNDNLRVATVHLTASRTDDGRPRINTRALEMVLRANETANTDSHPAPPCNDDEEPADVNASAGKRWYCYVQ